MEEPQLKLIFTIPSPPLPNTKPTKTHSLHSGGNCGLQNLGKSPRLKHAAMMLIAKGAGRKDNQGTGQGKILNLSHFFQSVICICAVAQHVALPETRLAITWPEVTLSSDILSFLTE